MPTEEAPANPVAQSEPQRANPGFHAPGGWSSEPRPVQPQAPTRSAYTPPQPQTPPQPAYTPPQPAYTPFQSANAPQQPAYTPPQPAYTPPQPVYTPFQSANAPQQPVPFPAQQDYRQPMQPPYVINNYTTVNNQLYQQPAARLATNRGLAKFILLSIVTFGIYSIVFYTNISTSLNTAASRYDGRKTMNYCLVFFIFSWLTIGIVPLVWFSKMSGRVGSELQRRGIYYSFGAGTFWLWNILGSLIFCGPFIYVHKLAKAMNLICEDYNMKG